MRARLPARRFRQGCVRLWLALGLLPALAAADVLPASHSPALQVFEWVQTDASGQQTGMQLQAQLHWPGNTQAGVQLSWSSLLDQAVATDGLGVKGLAWSDPLAVRAGMPGAVAPAAFAQAQNRLLLEASPWFAAQLPALVQGLITSMQGESASEAWVAYRQDLRLGGSIRSLQWNLHAFASGNWFASSPALAAQTGVVLAARYISLAAGQGLPASLHYPDAGILSWQAQDGAGHPLGALHRVDAAGRFDGGQGLECLLGRASRSQCPATPDNLGDLAAALGAAQIQLDYLAGMQALSVPAGQGTRLALAGLQVDRSLRSALGACQGTALQFVNHYRATFQVVASLRHFVRQADSTWIATPVVQQPFWTPWLDWKTLQYPIAGVALTALADTLIDPDSGLLVSQVQFPPLAQSLWLSPIRCS